MNSPDFRILEGIRGLAAFIVVLNHARGTLFVGGQIFLAQNDNTLLSKALIALFQVTSLGLNAVIAFFVLSGFSIAHSISSGGPVSRFYTRRVVRLVPPCLGGLALALTAFVATQPDHFERMIPQYWSLYHEAIFYAIAPIVAAAAWRVHFAAAAVLGYVVGLVLGDGGTTHNFVFQYAFYFAVGVVAYHRRDLLQRIVLSKKAFAAAVVLGFGAMVATIHTLPRASVLLSCAYSLLLIANFQYHRITSRPLQLLGAMSYTMYVTHFATIVLWVMLLQKMDLVQESASSSLWLWLTAVPVCLLVSLVFFWSIGRPAMAVLDRLRKQGRGRERFVPPQAL